MVFVFLSFQNQKVEGIWDLFFPADAADVIHMLFVFHQKSIKKKSVMIEATKTVD